MNTTHDSYYLRPETIEDDEDHLTPRLRELRDTNDPGLPPSTSERRQETIRKKEAQLAQARDVAADVDRYLVALRAVPNPCVTVNIPKMTRRHLNSLKQRALAEANQCRIDLETLRKATW